jgi:hypothetical protein
MVERAKPTAEAILHQRPLSTRPEDISHCVIEFNAGRRQNTAVYHLENALRGREIDAIEISNQVRESVLTVMGAIEGTEPQQFAIPVKDKLSHVGDGKSDSSLFISRSIDTVTLAQEGIVFGNVKETSGHDVGIITPGGFVGASVKFKKDKEFYGTSGYGREYPISRSDVEMGPRMLLGSYAAQQLAEILKERGIKPENLGINMQDIGEKLAFSAVAALENYKGEMQRQQQLIDVAK